jgi:hypothetical protein
MMALPVFQQPKSHYCATIPVYNAEPLIDRYGTQSSSAHEELAGRPSAPIGPKSPTSKRG